MAATYCSCRHHVHPVSTHSHPKVAAYHSGISTVLSISFNTQPPEGGCKFSLFFFSNFRMFQHTATRRWLLCDSPNNAQLAKVSTHSHPKVAAWSTSMLLRLSLVSTHSHPKVAAQQWGQCHFDDRGFNTQPPEGGCCYLVVIRKTKGWFQHTATRRWLPPT